VPLSQLQVEMTQVVVDRFVNLKATTSRKDLVTQFKSPEQSIC